MFSLTALTASVLLVLIAAVSSRESNCSALNLLNISGVEEYIQLSKRRPPFKITLSSRFYGKGENIRVKIAGPLGSLFAVEVLSIETNERIGRFRSRLQSDLLPLSCGGADSTLLVTLRPTNSSRVSFDWHPPHSNKGTLILTGSFYHDHEYWLVKKNGPRIYYHLPRVKKEITMNPSCYGADANCLQPECWYEIDYATVNDVLRIRIEGSNTNKYAVAFAIANETVQELSDSIILACSFISGIGVKVFTRSMENDTVRNPKVDVDGDTFTCAFNLSLKVLKRSSGKTSLWYTHFRRQVNDERELLVLLEDQQLSASFRPLLKEDTFNVSCHRRYREDSQSSIDSKRVSIALLIVCLSFLSC